MDREKRQLRKLKRDLKKAGNKKRRGQLKRDLVENPEEAHRSVEKLGRNSTREIHVDEDPTRRKPADE